MILNAIFDSLRERIFISIRMASTARPILFLFKWVSIAEMYKVLNVL